MPAPLPFSLCVYPVYLGHAGELLVEPVDAVDLAVAVAVHVRPRLVPRYVHHRVVYL